MMGRYGEYKEGIVDKVDGICVVFYIVVAIVSLSICGWLDGRDSVRREAIERGYAEWTIDKNGVRTWRWK